MDYIKDIEISLNFIKKEPMTGSFQGMRYRLSKAGDEIEVCIWPEPYNYIKTKDELKQYMHFPLTQEGKTESVKWLNEQIDVQRALWDVARNTAWV